MVQKWMPLADVLLNKIKSMIPVEFKNISALHILQNVEHHLCDCP